MHCILTRSHVRRCTYYMYMYFTHQFILLVTALNHQCHAYQQCHSKIFSNLILTNIQCEWKNNTKPLFMNLFNTWTRCIIRFWPGMDKCPRSFFNVEKKSQSRGILPRVIFQRAVGIQKHSEFRTNSRWIMTYWVMIDLQSVGRTPLPLWFLKIRMLCA